ncbi:DUF6161 domain-containing protein [Aminobacter sp. P9b]|uniref:DUF6161 domain-containing protein n=1 Tax=Aminobacter sp. P9b TaxID=3133697 RepID=UPI00324E80D4
MVDNKTRLEQSDLGMDPPSERAEGFMSAGLPPHPTDLSEMAFAYFREATLDKRKPNDTFRYFEAVLDAYTRAKLTDAYSKFRIDMTAAERRKSSLLSGFRSIQTNLEYWHGKAADLVTTIEDPVAALEGLKASFDENQKLQNARQLWGDSARRARKAYAISWIALALLLVIVPAVVVWKADAVFTFFRSVGDTVLADLSPGASETATLISAISRLVLVTLPVALYIWLIRIVVRFNMRSLLLMDDAMQRNTMLETYLHLVEQDAAVKADRPLILEALFRRTPGHGPEAIEPPNLTDIIKLNVPTTRS